MIAFSRKKGFTLIELLAVLAIISILMSIVLGTIQTARIKARDARRSGDIRQVINALALMYDADGKFPCHTVQTDRDWSGNVNSDFMLPFIQRKFLTALPTDPSNGDYKYEFGTMGDPGGCGNYAFLGVYYEGPDF